MITSHSRLGKVPFCHQTPSLDMVPSQHWPMDWAPSGAHPQKSHQEGGAGIAPYVRAVGQVYMIFGDQNPTEGTATGGQNPSGCPGLSLFTPRDAHHGLRPSSAFSHWWAYISHAYVQVCRTELGRGAGTLAGNPPLRRWAQSWLHCRQYGLFSILYTLCHVTMRCAVSPHLT